MLTARRQQYSFSTHERMFLWKCQFFWDRKGFIFTVKLVIHLAGGTNSSFIADCGYLLFKCKHKHSAFWSEK